MVYIYLYYTIYYILYTVLYLDLQLRSKMHSAYIIILAYKDKCLILGQYNIGK